MRNHALIRAVRSENDSVRARATIPRKSDAALQDGELIIRARVREGEGFEVVVDMGISVLPADGLGCLEELAATLHGSVDVGLEVAGRTAFVDALPLFFLI